MSALRPSIQSRLRRSVSRSSGELWSDMGAEVETALGGQFSESAKHLSGAGCPRWLRDSVRSEARPRFSTPWTQVDEAAQLSRLQASGTRLCAGREAEGLARFSCKAPTGKQK